MSQEIPRAFLLPMLFAAASPAAPANEAAPNAIVVAAAPATEGTQRVAIPRDLTTIESPPIAQIGPYRLIEELGRGNMGVVWLAEQTEPFHRRVALKVLRPDRIDASSLRWFAAEMQTMASVEHEHIARLLDAGASGSGVPWLAMELVSGIAATTYCEDHHCATGERLQLFLDIADAVSHLHDRGIRHGDLKPDNILVLERNGRAVPKIVDFGLSTLIGHDAVDDDMVTGTPAYMAPEQFTMPGTAIDARADVFALGVVLHELLSGARPEGAVAIAADGVLQVAVDRRGLVAPRVHESLRGGWARIVGRALARHRDDRYQTVAEFTNDVRVELARMQRRQRWCGAAKTVAGVLATGWRGMVHFTQLVTQLAGHALGARFASRR